MVNQNCMEGESCSTESTNFSNIYERHREISGLAALITLVILCVIIKKLITSGLHFINSNAIPLLMIFIAGIYLYPFNQQTKEGADPGVFLFFGFFYPVAWKIYKTTYRFVRSASSYVRF